MAKVTEAVVQRLVELGDEGKQWLDELDSKIRALEQLWGCRFGEALGGGSAAYVALVTDRNGNEAIGKIALPDGGVGYVGFQREVAALQAGGSTAYVAILERNTIHQALLLERLGTSLEQLALTVEQQIAILGPTISAGWRPMATNAIFPTGSDQLDWLAEFLVSETSLHEGRVSDRVLNTALKFVDRRKENLGASFTLIHGDAHPANLLQASTKGFADSTFKLIDPEGLLSEPAHDLAIPLRGWVDELLAGDAGPLAVSWCEQLAELCRVDATAIWEWAFIERVSTGLLLTRLSLPEGPGYLTSAELICGAYPSR
jgi:streptomycin 6-kinase